MQERVRGPRPVTGAAGRLALLGLVVLAGSCTGHDTGGDGRGFAPVVRFDRERVILRITPGDVEVEGTYEFLCAGRGPDSLTLFYPYPQDSLLGRAGTRLVESFCGDGPPRPVPFAEHRPAGVSWLIPLKACKRLTVRTVYHQERRATYARYIVTSTAAWGHPLRHARFEIHLPEGAVPEEFSFPFEVDEELGPNAWVYEANDFMPKRDIIVQWSDAGKAPEPPG